MIGQRLNLVEIATTLLDGVVAHYAAATDPAVDPLPARRMIKAGDPAADAWDCEQLTVALQSIGYGQSDDATPGVTQVGVAAGLGMRHAIFEIALLRCVEVVDDTGTAPPDATMYAEGVRFMRDAGMLSQALTEIASRVRQGLAPHGVVRPGQILPAGPEGNIVGAVGLFQVTATELT